MTRPRWVRLVPVLIAAVALVAMSSPAVGGTPVVGSLTPNSRLATDMSVLRGHGVPGLAVDPSNASHVVLIDNNFIDGQCEYDTSFDGGHTWSTGTLQAPSGFDDPPCHTFDAGGYAHFNQSVAFGSGQNVYTTFSAHQGPQERPETHVIQGVGDSLLVCHSADGAKTWATCVDALQGGPMAQPYVIRPGLAVQQTSGGDRLFLDGWMVDVTSGGAQSGGGLRELVTAVSNDGGMTWSSPVVVSSTTDQIREPAAPVVGPDGAVYVAWRNRNAPSTAPHPLVVAKSTDGGQTWTQTQVATMQPGPANASNAAGFPRLAVDAKANRLYVVYDNFSPQGNVDVYLQHSTDDAATWSSPVQVNDDSDLNDHTGPAVSLGPDGQVNVVWLDYRNAYPSAPQLLADQEGNIYYASSTDGGMTFSANRRITDRSINLDDGLDNRTGSYYWYTPALASMGANSELFAWSDSRLGNAAQDDDDIELATLNFSSLASPAIQSLPLMSASDESVAASQIAYPAGEERIGNGLSKIVIAPANDPESAMAGSVLARASYGPLLLSPSGGLTKDLMDEVSRLSPSAIYLVGTSATLSSNVQTQLTAMGFQNVTRIQAATDDGVAAAVASALDQRSPSDKSGNVAAAPAAVVVNPASADASTAVALAAALGYPLLYTDAGVLPSATAAAIRSLDIRKVYVVGSTSSISDAVANHLTGAIRVSGPDPSATSLAVARLAAQLYVPYNVVYVADPGRPLDAAIAASSAARVGALVVLTPKASTLQAQTDVNSLHLGPLDEVVQVRSTTSKKKANLTLVLIFVAFGAVGMVLLLASVSMRRHRLGIPDPE